MRRLVQPGPVAFDRIEAMGADCTHRTIVLAAGLTLEEAITQPLTQAGARAATLRIRDLALDPLWCVMPGPADDASHVAYFSAPRQGEGRCLVRQANVTFGCRDGVPWLHCHAFWTEADGSTRGGHVLLNKSRVAAPCSADAWSFTELGIGAEPDRETNFSLLRPVRLAPPRISGWNAVLARIRPNEDLCQAVDAVAAQHGMRNASVRGSLGSLVGAVFADGRMVPDHATEVLVLDGAVRDGSAEIDMAVVDMQGSVHTGRLARGENAVCITFDLVLEAEK
jgi:predicted DNA-binding protein with PD1-like motif